MHLASYLGLARDSEAQLVRAFTSVAEHHRDEPDVEGTCLLLAEWSRTTEQSLAPVIARFGDASDDEPARLYGDLFRGPRDGPLALLRDLQDLYLLASEVQMCWLVIAQGATALRDAELGAACDAAKAKTKRQLAWITSRVTQAAPQALVVA